MALMFPRLARNFVKNQSHAFGAWVIRWLFGIKKQHLRTGLGWANDTIKLSTHGTTHVDAPWHYAPTSEGRPAKTIDEVPLDWCYGPGVKLDIRATPVDRPLSIADLEAAASSDAGIGIAVQLGSVVVDRVVAEPGEPVDVQNPGAIIEVVPDHRQIGGLDEVLAIHPVEQGALLVEFFEADRRGHRSGSRFPVARMAGSKGP